MTLIEKLENNERLSYEDGVALYELDLFTLGHYANMRRRARHGNKAFFNINRHINPTNICKDICKFCAFSANRKNPNPYTMSHEEILSILDDSVTNRGITEVHIVSAHNPDTGLEWYLEIFSKVKAPPRYAIFLFFGNCLTCHSSCWARTRSSHSMTAKTLTTPFARVYFAPLPQTCFARR